MFIINGTYDTPEIKFDPDRGTLEINGRSLPANSFEFYNPLIEQMNSYFKEPKELTQFSFKMDFISSSTSKIFQELFFDMEQAYKNGAKIQVNWFYKFGDDDIKELGDDLRQDTTFPFEYIAYK